MTNVSSTNEPRNGYAKFAAQRDLNLIARLQNGTATAADHAAWIGDDNVVSLISAKEAVTCGDKALRYVTQYGWFIFPANLENGGKKSYKSAEFSNGAPWGMTKDAAQIRRDFKKWLLAGVGVPTGRVNNLIDIEADTMQGHGVDGIAALAELEEELGPLPETLMAESPSGSPHRLYNFPPGLDANIWIKSTDNTLAPGVDMKADGGMFIAPPSARPDGVYRWLNELPIADLPEAWVKRILELNGEARARSNGSDGEASSYKKFSDERKQASLERLALAMDALPIEPPAGLSKRDYYVKIGHALKAATDGGVQGLYMFARFRSRAPDYDPDKVIKKWLGFHPKDTGAGTIFYFANEADPNWERGDNSKGIDAATGSAKARLLQSSAEFVANYVPPDYLVTGLLQRRYVYSLTAPTGSGKTAIALRIAVHVALGLPLAGRRVKKGRVLFFAGENPDDVRSRWIKLCEEMGYKPEEVDVVFMPFTLNLENYRKQIDAETEEHGPFSLLIVDTSASYYSGNDENDNVELGNHARRLRTFVELPGGPTILVTCHPTKTPNMENLLPRGGGAFLAEVDGNLVCLKEFDSMVVEITWHGKFRGPDFKTFAFKLVPGQSDKLVDSEGNKIWTITAQPISDAEQEQIEEARDRNQDELLRTMLDHPGLSLVGLAEKLRWFSVSGEPNKSSVHRMLKDLTKQKLAEKKRNKYVLTAKGEKEAEQLPPVHYVVVTPISEKPAARAGKATKLKGRSKEEKPTVEEEAPSK